MSTTARWSTGTPPVPLAAQVRALQAEVDRLRAGVLAAVEYGERHDGRAPVRPLRRLLEESATPTLEVPGPRERRCA